MVFGSAKIIKPGEFYKKFDLKIAGPGCPTNPSPAEEAVYCRN